MKFFIHTVLIDDRVLKVKLFWAEYVQTEVVIIEPQQPLIQMILKLLKYLLLEHYLFLINIV